MNHQKIIKQLMLERNIDINYLSNKLDLKPQSLRNKLNRGTYSVNDFIEILNILNCDIQVITRDTKKVFD